MIKLILSDLDGCLLKRGETNLTQNLISQIKALNERGIAFAVASGRCYTQLKEIFKDVKDIIYFICLDGAAIIYKNKLIYSAPIDSTAAEGIIKNAENHRGIEKYIYKKNPDSNGYDDIYKIALTGDGIIFKGKQLTRMYEEKYVSIVPTDKSWYEIVSKGTNKGVATKVLLDKLNISPDNAMAIGDNYNDIEMLTSVNNSYAMEYAWPKVKASARNTTNNIETLFGGVING